MRVLNKKSKKTKFVSHFFGRAKFLNTSFSSDWLGSARRTIFEDVELPVMNNIEAYLSTRYGSDYMSEPDDDVKALYPGHCIKFKLLNSSCSIYVSR